MSRTSSSKPPACALTTTLSPSSAAPIWSGWWESGWSAPTISRRPNGRPNAWRTLPGLHGVILPLYPRTDPLNSDIYDPLWAVVQDLELPVHVHVAVGDPRLSKPLGNDNPHIHGAYPAAMNDNFMGTYEALSKVIFGGMLERFPRLKFVLVESRIGWLPFFLERSDNVFQRHRHWSKLQLKEPPSFYFHRQVYATFIEDRAGIEARHRIGVDNIMWSSDYPHTDTTWPNSRNYIEDTFQGVNEQDRHKLLVGNAAKLYKL